MVSGFGLIKGTVMASAWSKWGKPQKKVTLSGLEAESLSQLHPGMEHECFLLSVVVCERHI
jgi:hypothetical protein